MACPFCHTDYKITHQSGWLEIPWDVTQLYDTRLELTRHVSAYHYPFVVYYRCAADGFACLTPGEFEHHITRKTQAHEELPVFPERWTRAEEYMYDRAGHEVKNSNPYYVAPIVPCRISFRVLKGDHLYRFGPWPFPSNGPFIDQVVLGQLPLKNCGAMTL